MLMEKIIGTGVIMLCGAALTLARRYKNTDKGAGYGISGWTIFFVFILWMQGADL